MLALDCENISITFSGLASPALAIEALHIAAGERVAITGASGSGKSTFVNIITGLEHLPHGTVRWNDRTINTLSESARDRWRGENIGLVMQDFHLFPGLSALDNILLPLRLSIGAKAQDHRRARDLMMRVGLKRPEQHVERMSRGEMQRVAIARALLRKPGVIIADEPTASLDARSGEDVGKLLVDLAKEENSTLIVVSHDTSLTNRLDRRIALGSGVVVEDTHMLAELA